MNIFVAKLDYSTSSESLRELFEEFGEVSTAKVIMDRETGNSRGFGFVEMPNDAEAYMAIGELNGSTVDGREIVVKKAEPRENRSENRNQGHGGGYQQRPRFNRGGGGDRYNRYDRFNRGGGGGDRYNRGGGGDRFNRGGGGDRYNRNDRYSREERDNNQEDNNNTW